MASTDEAEAHRTDVEPAPDAQGHGGGGAEQVLGARLRLGAALRRPVPPFARWLALLCGWVSIHPTLMPRGGVTQGIVTGLSVGLGVLVGTLLAAIGRALWGLTGRPVPAVPGGHGGRVFTYAAVIVGIVGSVQWVAWQNEQRELLGMEPLSPVAVLPAALVAVLVFGLFFLLGRLLAHPVRLLDRVLDRHVPRPAAHLVTAVVVVVLTVVVTRDVVIDRAADFVNDRYGTVNTDTPDDVAQPTTDLRAGGPGSVVSWDSLGFEGRAFAGGGPTQEQLEAFAGAGGDVQEPIRAYVGLRSSETPEEQARLAVEQLDATDAWDREIVAIATVTGTGWINPTAADGLEYMYAGDTAMVGIQYSYLPSWISFLVDRDEAAASGRALVSAVVERWDELPEDDRPMLVAYGESLGSFGSESAFAEGDAAESFAEVADRLDGTLWAGPTHANPIWRQLVDERASGSPAWHPELAGGDGDEVRVLGRPDEPAVAGPEDPAQDSVYLTHPSDPVTWADAETLWQRPQWMDSPTGYDIPDHLLWFPGVTFVQGVFDLMAGFGAPPGFGHDYNPNIPDGWAALAAPDGWTAADTTRLGEALVSDGDNSSG